MASQIGEMTSMSARGYSQSVELKYPHASSRFAWTVFAVISVFGAVVLLGGVLVFVYKLVQLFAMALWLGMTAIS